MQGNEAVTNLIAALEQVGQQAERLQLDAVVLIRGGGAQLDLDCFDDYQLAVTIAKFPLPLFTGIGHERDETIADLVGHTSLKTPTAVAEFVLSSFREFEEQLGLGAQRLDWMTRNTFKEENSKVQEVALQIKGLVKQQLSRELDKVTSYQARMLQSGKSHTKHENGDLDQKVLLLKKEMQRFLKLQREKLDQQEISIRQLDPINLFQKGYTRTESKGLPIQLIQLEVGDSLTTYTQLQKINSTITKLEKK
jgi:exodeoxyribonuclease VII large subunit